VFYPNPPPDLREADKILENLLKSKLAPIAFGLALFCSGQSSTITGTLAGQIVMEGFIKFKLVPWLRQLITRLLAIIPAVIVIAIAGEQQTQKLLVLSQVILSLQLPFAVVPLIRFTSSSDIMGSFSNPLAIKILAWVCTVIIVGMNCWMVGAEAILLMEGSRTGLVLGILLIIPFAVFLMGLLAYLIWKKIDVKNTYRKLEDIKDIEMDEVLGTPVPSPEADILVEKEPPPEADIVEEEPLPEKDDGEENKDSAMTL